VSVSKGHHDLQVHADVGPRRQAGVTLQL
jgi:hypothetical protein